MQNHIDGAMKKHIWYGTQHYIVCAFPVDYKSLWWKMCNLLYLYRELMLWKQWVLTIYRGPDFLPVDRMIWLLAHPLQPPSLDWRHTGRWERGEGGRGGAETYDRKKARSSINHSLLSVWKHISGKLVIVEEKKLKFHSPINVLKWNWKDMLHRKWTQQKKSLAAPEFFLKTKWQSFR
jgi:hypothetical protein